MQENNSYHVNGTKSFKFSMHGRNPCHVIGTEEFGLCLGELQLSLHHVQI